MTKVYWIKVRGEKILNIGNFIRLKEEAQAVLVERVGQTSSKDYRFWPSKTDVEEHLENHHDPDQWGWIIDNPNREFNQRIKWDAVVYFIDPTMATYFKLLWGGESL